MMERDFSKNRALRIIPSFFYETVILERHIQSKFIPGARIRSNSGDSILFVMSSIGVFQSFNHTCLCAWQRSPLNLPSCYQEVLIWFVANYFNCNVTFLSDKIVLNDWYDPRCWFESMHSKTFYLLSIQTSDAFRSCDTFIFGDNLISAHAKFLSGLI